MRYASLIAAGMKVLGRIRRCEGSRVLRLTAAVVPGRKALVELAFADKTDTIVVGGWHVMEGGFFTILLIVRQIIVEDQVLDALLFLALSLLLRAHSNSECRVRRQINGTSLGRMVSSHIGSIAK